MTDFLSRFSETYPGLFYMIGRGTLSENEPMYGALIFDGEEEIGSGESATSAIEAFQQACVAAGLDWHMRMDES